MQLRLLLLLVTTVITATALNYCAACVDSVMIWNRHFVPHVIVPEGWPECETTSSMFLNRAAYAVECEDACVSVGYTYGGLGLTFKRMLHCSTHLMLSIINKTEEMEFPIVRVKTKGQMRVSTCFGNLCNFDPEELRKLIYCSNEKTVNKSVPRCPSIYFPKDNYPNPPYNPKPRPLFGCSALMSLYTVVISVLMNA